MSKRDTKQLRASILAAGVAVEQLGLADGVQVEVDDDGQITVYLGEESEEEFDDVDEALERIEEYADEYGASGARPGAIIDFVRRLAQLVEGCAAERRLDALVADYDNVLAIADKMGLEHQHKVYVGDLEVQADDDGDVGFFEDSNAVLWHVFVDDGEVRYKLFDRAE